MFSSRFRSIFPVTKSSLRNVHYQIGRNGEKIVVSLRHNIKSEREEWQKVAPMGYEKELREIKRIELDERLHADPKVAKQTAQAKLDKLRNKLHNAGFCRDRKSYNPPEDVIEQFGKIVSELNVKSIEDMETKFKLLTACADRFNHEVPNSTLHELKTLEDVLNFYQTPVRGINSYDHMVNQQAQLPKNLHVIPEAIRFNPETDTFFGGIDAFPGSSNQLVGLRAQKRYEAKPQRFEWPDV